MVKKNKVVGIGVEKSIVKVIHGLNDKESEDLEKFMRKADRDRDPEVTIKKALSSSNLNNKQIAAVGFIVGYALGSFSTLKNIEEQQQTQIYTKPSTMEVV